MTLPFSDSLCTWLAAATPQKAEPRNMLVEFLLLAGVGFACFIVSKILKRGRLEHEAASILERLLWAAGILIVLACAFIAIFRSDLLLTSQTEKKQKTSEDIQEFDKEGSGCSKPTKQIKDFKQ